MQNADNHFSNLLVSWLSCFAHSFSCIPPPRMVNMQFRELIMQFLKLNSTQYLNIFEILQNISLAIILARYKTETTKDITMSGGGAAIPTPCLHFRPPSSS